MRNTTGTETTSTTTAASPSTRQPRHVPPTMASNSMAAPARRPAASRSRRVRTTAASPGRASARPPRAPGPVEPVLELPRSASSISGHVEIGRHPADRRDRVEEDLRPARRPRSGRGTPRTSRPRSATARSGRSAATIRWPSARARTPRTTRPPPCCAEPPSCSTRPSGEFRPGSEARQRRDVPVEAIDRAERRGRAARREQHREPAVREPRLVVLGLDLDRPTGRPRAGLRSRAELRQRLRAPSGVSSVSRVGCSASSTISPPFDQTNGASRIIVGSTPSP